MRHEDVRNHLSDYIEGLLDSALAAAIENHLRQCDACAHEEHSLRAVFHALDDPAMDVTPPPMFHADAMRKVRLAAQSGADRRGFWERLGWPTGIAATAAAAALVVALVINIGPVGNGTHAGYTPALQSTASRHPLFIEVLAPAHPGQAVLLRLSGPAANADMNTEPSEGFDTGKWTNPWDGRDLKFMLRPNTAGTVQEVVVRTRGAAQDAMLMVFIPVETGGSPDQAHSWQSKPGDTLRAALEAAARMYGVSIVAPDAALNTPVSVLWADGHASTAIPAIARAAGLTAVQRNGTWQLGG